MNHLNLKTLLVGIIIGAVAMLSIGAVSETEKVGRYQLVAVGDAQVHEVIIFDTATGKAEMRGVSYSAKNKVHDISGLKIISFGK
jgi:hypothetical protein